MTKKILLIGAFLLLSSHFYSQEHQISAGMGLGSTNQILDSFVGFGSRFSAIFFNTSYLNKTKNLGEFRLAYKYAPKERWHFGTAFSYNQSEFEVMSREEKTGEQVNDYYTIAAESSFTFLKKERLRLYVLLGAGVTFGNIEQTKYASATTTQSNGSIFNFQFTPIGISYGKQYGGFAEMGFGYRGLLSFGGFYNFN